MIQIHIWSVSNEKPTGFSFELNPIVRNCTELCNKFIVDE